MDAIQETQERDWPLDAADVLGGGTVRFTLRYEGVLPASTRSKTRVNIKHAMRKDFDVQIRQLWKNEAILNGRNVQLGRIRGGRIVPCPGSPDFTELHQCVLLGGFLFTPLVTYRSGLVCHLDIRLLRDGNPGDLVRHGGDLDAHLKTLFDALRIPHSVNELGGDVAPPPRAEPQMFMCLLEDDSLIPKFSVEAQRRLRRTGEPEGHVSLQIGVDIRSVTITDANQRFVT
jgi:hypothetical protein